MRIEHQEDLERGVGNTLVAVEKRMTANKGEAQGGGLLGQRRIEIYTVKRGFGLRDCSFDDRQVANTSGTARNSEESVVKLKDLRDREVPHFARRR